MVLYLLLYRMAPTLVKQIAAYFWRQRRLFSSFCYTRVHEHPTTHTPEQGAMSTLARLRVIRSARGLYYGWVLAVALGITTIVSYGTTQYLFGVLVEPMSQEFGWSRASLSGAYTFAVVLAGLLGLPIGRLLDRRGARLLMTIGSALGGCTLLTLASIHALWQFYLLWAGGVGLATALTFYPVTFTVIANWFARRRGSALALLTLLGGLASPVFIPLAGTLIPSLGWRGTLLIMGTAQLVIALPLHALLLRRRPEDLGWWPDGATNRAIDQEPVIAGVSLQTALRTRAFWLLTGAYSLLSLASNVVFVHQIAYLIERGVSGTLAASVAGLVGLSSLPGRYVLNWLSDRIRPQLLLSLCLIAQALGVLLLLQGQAFGWLIAYILVYGIAFGAISPLRAGVMAEHFGRRAYGAITAVQGLPVALCAGFGPLIAGWLYDLLGHYEPAFWLSIGALLLAALGVVGTPRPSEEAARSSTRDTTHSQSAG
jgi:MFS family permease